MCVLTLPVPPNRLCLQDPCQEVAHTCQLALQRIEFFKAAEAAHQAAAAADPNATGALVCYSAGLPAGWRQCAARAARPAQALLLRCVWRCRCCRGAPCTHMHAVPTCMHSSPSYLPRCCTVFLTAVLHCLPHCCTVYLPHPFPLCRVAVLFGGPHPRGPRVHAAVAAAPVAAERGGGHL